MSTAALHVYYVQAAPSSACIYPLQAFGVGKGYALFITGYFCPDIYCDKCVCVHATRTYILVCQFLAFSAGGRGGGVSSSEAWEWECGRVKAPLEDTTLDAAAMYTEMWDGGDPGLH